MKQNTAMVGQTLEDGLPNITATSNSFLSGYIGGSYTGAMYATGSAHTHTGVEGWVLYGVRAFWI